MERISRAHFLVEHIGEYELMLTDTVSKRVTLLNSSAAVYYDLCNNLTLQESISRYVDACAGLGVDDDTLSHDATQIFERLRNIGILEYSEEV